MSDDPRANREPALPKRFYTEVTVETRPDGETILLDGKTAQTPSRKPFALPSPRLAEAVAAEWRAQRETIDPRSMPLTRLAATAIDGVTPRLDQVRDDIVRYAGSDLICYRAGEPEGLVARQTALWDPLVRWADEALGAPLVVTEGVTHTPQPPEVVDAISSAVHPLDPFRLSAVHVMTSLCGSVVIALAVLFRRLSVDDAWAAAHVDEDWNAMHWGEDAEAAARRSFRKSELESAARLLGLM